MINPVNNFLLFGADNKFDYIPLLSTLSNLTDLFLKIVVLPQMDRKTIINNRHYIHLDQKSFFRCICLLIPVIGNIAIGIYDFSKMKKENIKIEESHSLIATQKARRERHEAYLKRNDDKEVITFYQKQQKWFSIEKLWEWNGAPVFPVETAGAEEFQEKANPRFAKALAMRDEPLDESKRTSC